MEETRKEMIFLGETVLQVSRTMSTNSARLMFLVDLGKTERVADVLYLSLFNSDSFAFKSSARYSKRRYFTPNISQSPFDQKASNRRLVQSN